jgi:hypothetical protein
MRLNESCQREFQISSWPQWHYDLDRTTLTFLRDGFPRVVASIQVVGTTSTKSGTWLWAWDNQHLPSQSTHRMAEVRAFGEQECLTELRTPKLTDDEYLGWGMAAIAAKILGAKGAYRCPGENGFLYVVYTDISFVISSESEKKLISCDEHETGYETFICEHLLSQPIQQWFSDDPGEENKWPDAWCSACDAFFQQQGEWNDKNESKMKIKLICHHCYESLRTQAKPNSRARD